MRYTIEITEFVKSQVNNETLKYIEKIREDANFTLNFDTKNCRQGLYKFSKIIKLKNNYNLSSPIVRITNENSKFLISEYSRRRKGELEFLKRFFPINSNVKGEVGDHIDVILYNNEQLKKEKNKN